MATRKTLNFLPSIFRTDANKKFLGSTVDQLLSEPDLTTINNFIGRKFSTAYKPENTYNTEINEERQNYQFEPAVVIKNQNLVEKFSSYTDLIDAIRYYGGNTSNHQRLFESEYYSYDPKIDFDKFVNYTKYYWLPNGPDAVEIKSGYDLTPKTYVITRTANGYTTDQTGNQINPELTLARGATYQFVLNQAGHDFYLQTEPGEGVKQYNLSVTSREIQGVSGTNGIDQGTLVFSPPASDEQNYYFEIPAINYVDYASATPFTNLDGRNWLTGSNPLLDIDGSNENPINKYIVFLSDSSDDQYWVDQSGDIVDTNLRTGIWQITLSAENKIVLTHVRNIPVGYRLQIKNGVTNKGYEYFKNTTGNIVRSPAITAPYSVLYYQDATDLNFYGKINLVNPNENLINVEQDIIGKSHYTSPLGIKFENGLKIKFDGTVNPSSYRNKTYIVEGVCDAIKLVDFGTLQAIEIVDPRQTIKFDTTGYDNDNFDGFITGLTEPDYIVMNRASKDLNAWTRINRWVHEDIVFKTAEYLGKSVDFSNAYRAQRPIIEFNANIQLFNTGKNLLDYIDRYDTDIINSNSSSNWVKITDAFSQVNNQRVNSNSLRLMEYKNLQKVVFPNDTDVSVKSRIYQITFKDQQQSLIFENTGNGSISCSNDSIFIFGTNTNFTSTLTVGSWIYNNSGQFIGKVKNVLNDVKIELEAPAALTVTSAVYKYNNPLIELIPLQLVNAGDYVVVKSGRYAKKNFWFNGQNWFTSQQKTKLNQPILFDVLDSNGNSFASDSYPSSTFNGTKIFSYSEGSGLLDAVLGFSISYNNVGSSISDINFDNNFENETFSYSLNGETIVSNISTGFLKINVNASNYKLANVWQTVNEPTKQYQHFKSNFDGITNYFEIDITPTTELKEKNVKLYINNLPSDSFIIEQLGAVTALKVTKDLVLGDHIDILIFNKTTASETAYYQIPSNLEFNALNKKFSSITLGQARFHWDKIVENTNTSNSCVGNANAVGGTILQHSSSLVNSSIFLTSDDLNFINSINYARREYTRFKNKFLDISQNFETTNYSDIPKLTDQILSEIVRPKNSKSAWYYSDMVPSGVEYVVDTYKIINVTTKSYNLNNIIQEMGGELYDFGSPTAKAILVYLNNVQLMYGIDYTFNSNSIAITLNNSVSLTVGDILTVRGYPTTDGCYVPETPTKLGLYPKFLPKKYLDDSYRDQLYVIQGHDGSLTPAFNDYRDDLLLELEKRIYNNIKVSYAKDLLNKDKIIPGKFRNNDYTLFEFNQIITPDFMRWVGANQIDYSTNNFFQSNDAFTWNYNQTTDSISGEQLVGYWRGIYRYFYDTDRPHSHPWELLGITEKPSWWDTEYGPPPYSSTNTKLWQDLELGYNRNLNTYDSTYARPLLSKIIPVDSSGQLIPPNLKLVRNFNGTNFSQSFSIGDVSPVESAWRRSSEYPFAVQKALALMKPAQYFALMADTTKIVKNADHGQIEIYDTKLRPTITDIKINGRLTNGKIDRVASYVNWIKDYNVNLGFNADELISRKLENTDVNLSYRMAGFSDKKYLTALVDQFSPTSTSESVIVPDENYQLFLNKSVPRQRVVYSAVIVEKTTTGYSISGYDLSNPYFTVIPSELKGKFYAIEVLGSRALIFQEYINQLVTVPYGYELTTPQEVVDFLISYQRFLNLQGFVFEDYQSDLSQVKNWVLSAKEFLTWNLQGWSPGNVIVLSPVVDKLIVLNNTTVVDKISNKFEETQILNPSFKTIPLNEITLVKDTDLTTIKVTSGQTVTFADLNLVQYEHVLIFDNQTVFNDTIYKSELGNRQYRIKLIGNKTNNWNGSLHAPGFIYSSGVVEMWQPGKDYVKGDLVRYKQKNYVALQKNVAENYFDSNKWQVTDIDIKTGLLPNFSYNAVASEEFYNIDSLTINENYDLFSNSLIGYRSRPYLENLGMDQTTQSKFYQGYIKAKGSLDSIKTLYAGKFDETANQLKFYEEWAVRVGEYGASELRQQIEIPLLPTKFKTNPISFELTTARQQSSSDKIINLSKTDLYNYPVNYNGSVFLNRPDNFIGENDLPTAGYVNISDVDYQLFSLTDYTELNNTVLDNISDGIKLWVAKDFGNNWQVFKINQTNVFATAIEYSLDNKIKIVFDGDHGLRIGEVFAIKNFEQNFDGFYQVVNVEDYNTVVVTFNIDLLSFVQEPLEGFGEMYVLSTLRYANTAERNSKMSSVSREVADIAWVDDSGNKTWSIYKLLSAYHNNFSTPNTEWNINNGLIQIRSNGLPYHAYGNVAVENTYNRIWQLHAGDITSNTTPSIRTDGIVGFWLNGVPILSPDLGDFIPDGSTAVSELNYNLGYKNFANLEIDQFNGISNINNQYLYIDSPLTAWQQNSPTSEINSIEYFDGSLSHPDGHSKIIGFSIDGYPIYGPFGYIDALDSSSGIRRILSGYRLKDVSYRNLTEATDLDTYPMGIFVQDYEYDGNGNLDQHNGRYCVTPDYPNGTYAYFISTNAFNELVYPYVIGNTFKNQVPIVKNTLISAKGIAPSSFGFTSNINLLWQHQESQQSTVDIDSLTSLYIYNNRDKSFITYLDYIDPIKGKILGVAQDDIDYISSYDPAKYNKGSNSSVFINPELHWGSQQLGIIWWDIDSVRFVDYTQYDLEYRLNNWGNIFPGSSIDVYEWTKSDVLPSEYVAAGYDGVPKHQDNSAYAIMQHIDPVLKTLREEYFYWVKNKSSVSDRNKKNSISNISQMIVSPGLQNIPYVACLKDNSIAVYNIGQYTASGDVILFIGFKTKQTDTEIFNEFELLQEGNPNSQINKRVEDKLIDSLVGFDTLNNLVPDLTLPMGNRIGLSTKPNQTLINDRLSAVKNVIMYVNGILSKHPMTSKIIDKNKVYSDNLYAKDPEPSQNEYDFTTDTLAEFGYIAGISSANVVVGHDYVISSVGNTDFTNMGAISNSVGTIFTANATGGGTGIVYPRRVLIKRNSEYDNYWTIVEKEYDGSLGEMIKLQKFDTEKFWSTVDWYSEGFNSKTKINYRVARYVDIFKLDLNAGDVIKVENPFGNFEIYQVASDQSLMLKGIGNGTIQLSERLWQQLGYDTSSYDTDLFDFDNAIELRYIFKAIKEDLFVDNYKQFYNSFIFYIIKYILTKQKYVDWVFKTSFISIIHGVSKLTQEKNYIKDRQLNYQNYVNEVKPYKTKLREYVLNYQYNEITDGLAVTDFDIPAYYDKDFEIFRSPNGQSPAVDSNLFSNDSRYQDWKNHYKYEIGNIDVVNSGIGHLTAPDISIEPIDTTGVVATVNSIINSAGQVIGADIKNPGGGYTQTPIINVSGTGTLGTNDPFGTKLSVRLDNKKIRKIKTSIKFDRITYNSEVVEWQPGVAYAANVLVSYQGIGYITSNTVPASQTFSSGLFTKVDSSSYTNASDRIISYYSPTSEMIPKVLDRLMTGISNPIVTASDGDIDTFIEGGNFTGISTPVSQLVAGERYIITSVDGTDFTLIGALDNKVGLIFTATGAGSGDGEAVQVIDAAAFSNIGGLSPDDIVVTGGAFVDRIFSHAPEEMLPGMTYDTVSFKVIDNSLTGEIGYRRFIDIEGNVYNSVINENTITTLAQDLNISDSTITVADASTLPTPSVLTLQPGILHINGERIEYYTKTNNVLGQLRRGSGGTAIALVHKSGSSVETTNDEILIPFE